MEKYIAAGLGTAAILYRSKRQSKEEAVSWDCALPSAASTDATHHHDVENPGRMQPTGALSFDPEPAEPN